MRRFIAALLVLVSQTAQAFVDPPTLAPPNPTAGQTVSVSITSGICDAFTNNPPPTITTVGNNIRIVIESVSEPDGFCVFPPSTTSVFPVGAFDAGTYSLQVDRTYNSTSGPVTETLGTLAFVIKPIASTPTLTVWGEVILCIALLGVGATMRRRYNSLLFLMCLVLRSQGGAAQSTPDPPAMPKMQVLLSAAAGAPTPEQVVSYFSTTHKAPSQPPLQSLSMGSPQSAAFLLPLRATGNFLAYLQANPSLSRSKLERYVIVTYPAGTNLQTIASTMRADPNVEAASPEAGEGRFSSAQLTGFTVTQSGGAAPISTGPQYGRDDLNIDAAWQLAGGYALIGDVDSGLYTSHSALQQFSSSGQYLGGNFVPASSLNIGSAGQHPEYTAYWTDPNVDEEYPPLPAADATGCNPNNLTAVPPSNAGHGTHVSGLIAANPSSTYGLKGTCLHCGIAMYKVTFAWCSADHKVYSAMNLDALSVAITYLSDTGAQVINLSLGFKYPKGYCATTTDHLCDALTYATYRDITIVAAGGNSRSVLQFPANDARALDAGGFDQNLSPRALTIAGNRIGLEFILLYHQVMTNSIIDCRRGQLLVPHQISVLVKSLVIV